MNAVKPTIGLRLYRTATTLFSPVAPTLLRRRLARGKEDDMRWKERLGKSSAARPQGRLIWIHGASVGECLAALPLIDVLLQDAAIHVMITSGTVTSAQLMAERLPERAFHQFIPVDTPGAVRRFLDRWKPDIGLFVDSEIWPNLLMEAKARGIALAMINGRLSERSYSGWRYAPQTAKTLLSLFDHCLAQDDETAQRLRLLGARNVETTGSLKADAPPLPATAENLERLQAAIGNRPLLLASSTHPGEDETILPAHDTLKRTYRDLLTIIVPRHPSRGTQIATLSGTRKTALRSKHGEPASDTEVYIADTLGELGLFYRVAPFAFIGGSIIAHGGQNPLEAARLHCAIMAGPHTENFAPAYRAIFEAQGCGRVRSAAEIAALASDMIAAPERAHALADGAAGVAASFGGAVEKTRKVIETMLASHAPA